VRLQRHGAGRRRAEKAFGVGQGFGRSGLQQALADETLQRQLAGLDHHHQLGGGDIGITQRRADGLGVVHFDLARPAQALGRGLHQA
jgi:hypothetical protein